MKQFVPKPHSQETTVWGWGFKLGQSDPRLCSESLGYAPSLLMWHYFCYY